MKLVIFGIVLSPLTGLLSAVLAQTVGVPSADIPAWMTGSVVTVLAGAVIAYTKEWITPGARTRRAEEELQTRNKEDRELLIPALIRNTEVLSRVLEQRNEGA